MDAGLITPEKPRVCAKIGPFGRLPYAQPMMSNLLHT